jgi:hypothetical protein
MTKKVRIENADTSAHKVLVQVWDKGLNGGPDELAHEIPLYHPTALTDTYVHARRYLVIKEVD